MQPGLLPLFPLQAVLLPGAPLPLHIFEDRYKEMMAEVIRDRIEFGVVLAS
jgi:Lon protease-like protein